jgi:hypothetical protein
MDPLAHGVEAGGKDGIDFRLCRLFETESETAPSHGVASPSMPPSGDLTVTRGARAGIAQGIANAAKRVGIELSSAKKGEACKAKAAS